MDGLPLYPLVLTNLWLSFLFQGQHRSRLGCFRTGITNDEVLPFFSRPIPINGPRCYYGRSHGTNLFAVESAAGMGGAGFQNAAISLS